MRTPNLGTIQFSVGNPGDIQSVGALLRYVQELEQRISSVVIALARGHLDELHAPPQKPRTGDLALADGTDWNPGSGRGVYWYDEIAMQWNILG
jgi:hypothetical protein